MSSAAEFEVQQEELDVRGQGVKTER